MFVTDGGKRLVIPRTEMAYPGHNPKMHRNAADPERSPVDHVMADFEDACPYEWKGPRSREVVVEALNTLDFGSKIVTVRPNNVRSRFFIGDLEAIVNGAPNRFHGIVLPKVSGPDDIAHVARLLDTMEKEAGWKVPLQIEALIETPRALLRAYEIATASPRMVGLIFGIADFAATLGIRDFVEEQNQNFLYAKQGMVVAAKAAGLHAIDNVYTKLWRPADPAERVAEVEAGLRRKNQGSAKLGMDGTWVIHPQQARIANECYSPGEADIANAKRIVALYHERGGGSMADPETGEMIDEATVQVAIADLAKGVQSGHVSPAFLAEQAAKSRQITGYDILDQLRRM